MIEEMLVKHQRADQIEMKWRWTSRLTKTDREHWLRGEQLVIKRGGTV